MVVPVLKNRQPWRLAHDDTYDDSRSAQPRSVGVNALPAKQASITTIEGTARRPSG